MLRRLQMTPARRVATSAALTSPSRGYFCPGTGEVGIWGASMKQVVYSLYFFIGAWTFILHKTWNRYNPDRQWICGQTDLWEDDGTVMEGEEAVAKMKIDRARVLPFLEQYEEKINAATGGAPASHSSHH